MQYHVKPSNTGQYHAIPCNTMQYYSIQSNTMKLKPIPCIIINCWRSVPLPCGQYNGHFLHHSHFDWIWYRRNGKLCTTKLNHNNKVKDSGSRHKSLNLNPEHALPVFSSLLLGSLSLSLTFWKPSDPSSGCSQYCLLKASFKNHFLSFNFYVSILYLHLILPLLGLQGLQLPPLFHHF